MLLKKKTNNLKLQVDFLKQQLEYKTFGKPLEFGGRRMSGDIGLEQPIIFYHEEMTEAKKIVLEHKGIKLAYLEINNQKVSGKDSIMVI